MKYVNDKESEICSKAERAFVRKFDGGCSSPIAAFAELKNNKIKITGFYADDSIFEIKSILGNIDDGEELGIELAEKIKEVIYKYER